MQDMPAPEPIDVPAQPPKPKPTGNGKRRGALSKLMDRATTDHAGNGGHLRRRRIVFVVDPAACEPGAFDEPFEIVLEAPSAEQELLAAKKHGTEPAAMILELIRQCIVSVDGEPVRDHDLSRDAVWEALGMSGRSLISLKFSEINGVPPEARKKADSTTRLLLG